ncbi:MAG: DUF309 domain-containing protein [Sulfitobacter sp.]
MSDQPIRLPDHAYVPGITTRHPEGAFDDSRATVSQGMSEDALAQSAAFQAGLLYRAAGYFWEAHEVLEPVWMACPQPSDARALVQGIIQLANAQLKLVMQRPKAVVRLCDIADAHLAAIGGATVLGCDVSQLRDEIAAVRIVASEV